MTFNLSSQTKVSLLSNFSAVNIVIETPLSLNQSSSVIFLTPIILWKKLKIGFSNPLEKQQRRRAIDRTNDQQSSWPHVHADARLEMATVDHPKRPVFAHYSRLTARSTEPSLHRGTRRIGLIVDRYMKPVDCASGSGSLNWFQVSVFWIKFGSELGFLLLIVPLTI